MSPENAPSRSTRGSRVLNVTLSRDTLIEIDAWRSMESDAPGREEAIRRLIQIALAVGPMREAYREAEDGD